MRRHVRSEMPLNLCSYRKDFMCRPNPSILISVLLVLSMTLFTSCTQLPKRPIVNAQGEDVPLPFDTAVRLLTNQLLRELENEKILLKQTEKDGQWTNNNILINPFVFSIDRGNVLTLVSKGKKLDNIPNGKWGLKPTGMSMKAIMIQEAATSMACGDEDCRGKVCKRDEVILFPHDPQKCLEREGKLRFEHFSIQEMSSANFHQADYIMYGVVDLHKTNILGFTREKYYRIYASIVDKRTNIVEAKTDVLVLDEIFLENVPKNKVQGFIELNSSGLAYLLSDSGSYLVFVIPQDLSKQSKNLLLKAENAYKNRAYGAAEKLYMEFIELPGSGKTKAYERLYHARIRLDKMEESEDVLGEWINIGIAENQRVKLPFIFLFHEDSTRLLTRSEEKKQQYLLWLRQMGKILNGKQYCLHITGHSAPSDASEYTQRLSERRAQHIDRLIKDEFPDVITKISGKGTDECIVCTGSDNMFDAIDRRVELTVIDNTDESCSNDQL